MTRSLVFLPPASADVERAVHWYDDQAKGLGRAYLSDLRSQLKRITQFPDSYPRIDAKCRRSHLQNFPHTIIYRVQASRIEIVAVIHHRSDSDTLHERTSSH